MIIKLYYVDGTTWTGDPENYGDSADKGVAIMMIFYRIFYDGREYGKRLNIGGQQVYAIKELPEEVNIGYWAEYQPEFCIVTVKKHQEEMQIERVGPYVEHPTDMVERYGEWTSDENMRLIEKAAIQEWL